MFGKGIRKFIVIDKVFSVGEVLVHSHFKFLLSVTNAAAATFLASGFAHHNGFPAIATVDAFTIDLSGLNTVALQIHEVFGGHTIHWFDTEITLKNFS